MAEEKQIQGNLASQATQASVGLLVDDLIKQISPLQAYDLLQELRQSMSYAQLDEQASQFYRKQLNLLKFGAFSFLKEEEQSKLLQNNLVSAIKAGADVRGQIEHIFLPDFLGLIHEQKVRELTQSLESANEKLGQNPINVGGQTSPEIKNWLLDFKNFSSGKTGAYEIVNYLTNNQNARSLSMDDREALRNLLILYRWLRYEAVPENYLEPASSGADQTEAGESSQSEPSQVPAPKKITAPAPKTAKPAPALPHRVEESPQSQPVFTQNTEKKSTLHRPISAFRPKPAPKEDKFTQDYQALSSLPRQVESTALAKRNLDKLTENSSEEPASLSGSLINHGTDSAGDEARGMRKGTAEKQDLEPENEQRNKKQVAESQSKAPATVTPASASEELTSVLQKAGTAPAPKNETDNTADNSQTEPAQIKDAQKPDNGVIDLKRNAPINTGEITDPLQLARIRLSDLRSNGLEQGLQTIKQKIRDLAQKHELQPKQVAGYFFRSPAHTHYANTVVAITNDTSGDQRAAFEKLNRQLEASGKEHLSREEFLAFHKFKKELSA